MYAIYVDPERSAEDIARFAIEGAAEFDDSTGRPVTVACGKIARAKAATTELTAMPSFDIVSEVNQVEVHNAVDQATRKSPTASISRAPTPASS